MVATRGGPDVLVVGGLAGLARARDLTRAGLGFRVLEASDGVGGRMRSDRHEGFAIDRGFQVFNPPTPRSGGASRCGCGPSRRGSSCTPTTARSASVTRPGVPAGSATCVRDGSQAVGTWPPWVSCRPATCSLPPVRCRTTGAARPGGARSTRRGVRHRHRRLAAVDRAYGARRAAGHAAPQPLSRTARVGRRRYGCGDHRATGSVQGALASGARAAREVARDLAAQSPMGG